MSRVEVLEQAIRKAIANGWKGMSLEELDYAFPRVNSITVTDVIWQSIVYNHDFAKALWGEELRTCDCGGYEPSELAAWESHLREMVTADDPIGYLKRSSL